jgi:Immunity protein Imm1
VKDTTPLNVMWTDPQKVLERTINNVEQAIELTEMAYNADKPTMIEFSETETGCSLAVGLGRKHTVVTYQESLDPPYYISLGDLNCDGVTSFWYAGEETEYLLQNTIPTEQGQQALAFFVINRARPTNINWEKL